ncbi:hypothetical protein [Micromonospora sp. NPDC049274]|uniref:hypothetical protein n=1 Tax=Micromonospora sp. NPDC049274 TaxID=3154829 RepID=UPI003433219F
MNGPELRHALRASLGPLVTVVAPFVLLGASALGAWPVTPALWVSAAVLLATLVTVAAVAIRGINVPWWQRTLFLLALGVAGLVVVWLQTLAHGSAATADTEMAMPDPVPFVLTQGDPEKDAVYNRLRTGSTGDPTDLRSCLIDGLVPQQKRLST